MTDVQMVVVSALGYSEEDAEQIATRAATSPISDTLRSDHSYVYIVRPVGDFRKGSLRKENRNGYYIVRGELSEKDQVYYQLSGESHFND